MPARQVNCNSPKAHGGLAVLHEKPTIVFGVDVNHAAPNSSKPSYAALVSSLNADCTRFHTIVWAKNSRKEGMENDLGANVRIGLRQFRDKMGVHAQRIVFIRDGVANNQVRARGCGRLLPCPPTQALSGASHTHATAA